MSPPAPPAHADLGDRDDYVDNLARRIIRPLPAADHAMWALIMKLPNTTHKIRSPRRFAATAAAVLLLCLALAPAPAAAHETDQFSVPMGKQFADLSDHITDLAYDALVKGVEKTNRKIRQALARHASDAELAELYGPDVIANEVYTSFPNAVVLIEDLEGYVERSSTKKKFPGRVVGYQEFSYIYDHNFFPLDPRQVFKIWRASTIYVNGVYLGTDKIGHFTDMGMNYYKKYRAGIREGRSEQQAMVDTIYFGGHDGFLGERGVLGFLSSGVYSNADLASNYAGMKFYINLTQPTLVAGKIHDPLLVRDGDYWALAPHVARDSDFFMTFITPHFDEVLNPSLHSKGIREPVRQAIEKRADSVLAWYSDANGMQRTPEYFAQQMQDLKTYYGEDYGWWAGDDNEIITVQNTCFLPIESQLIHPSSGSAVQALQYACDGDAAALRIALRDSAAVNARFTPRSPYSSDAGNTPLHFAARTGELDVITTLLEAGADVAAVNVRSVTPLHMAVQNPEAARALIEAGANVNAVDLAGRSPLHWAANIASAETVALFIDHNADINLRDKNGQAPLHLAATNGDVNTITALIEAGADVNARARYDTTPLHLAALHNHAEAASTLIEAGADVNAADEYGCTPLHDAARLANIAVVKALIEAGANVNAADITNTTPLHLAARFNRPTVARMLLDAGADPGAGNNVGMSPIEEARKKRSADVSAIFAERATQ